MDKCALCPCDTMCLAQHFVSQISQNVLTQFDLPLALLDSITALTDLVSLVSIPKKLVKILYQNVLVHMAISKTLSWLPILLFTLATEVSESTYPIMLRIISWGISL
jgi:hypothetical protein